MTEAEWVSSTDPDGLILRLERDRRGGQRKFRLFVAACVRRVWPQLGLAERRRAVEVSERYADGAAGGGDLVSAWAAAMDAVPQSSAARTVADVAALEGARVGRGGRLGRRPVDRADAPPEPRRPPGRAGRPGRPPAGHLRPPVPAGRR